MKINSALRYVKNYLLIGLLIFFCQQAQIVGDYKGYAMSLFIALCYCRFNLAVLCPTYLAICLICDHSLFGIVYAITPIILLLIAKYLHYLFARPMRLPAAVGYSMLCVIPLAVLDVKSGIKLELIVYLVSQVVVCLLFCAICYAVAVRGIGRRLSGDETVGGFVFLAIIANGLYAIDIYGFRIFYLVLGLAIPYLYRNFSLPQGIVIVSGIAVGAGLTGVNLAMAGGIVLIFLTAYVFVFNKWIAGLSAILAHVICGLYFDVFAGEYYFHLIAFAAGIVITTSLTDKFINKLPSFKYGEGRESAKELVNRSRRDLSARIGAVSGVFYEMSEIYSKNVVRYLPPDKAAAGIAQEVLLKTCGNCINREYCRNALGNELNSVLEGVVRTALTSGKATLEDLPTFLSSKCIQLPTLLATCNHTALSYDIKYNSGKEMEVDQKLVAGQLLGVSDILSGLGEEIKSAVNIDDRLDCRGIGIQQYRMQRRYDACQIGQIYRVVDSARKRQREKSSYTDSFKTCQSQIGKERGEEIAGRKILSDIYQLSQIYDNLCYCGVYKAGFSGVRRYLHRHQAQTRQSAYRAMRRNGHGFFRSRGKSASFGYGEFLLQSRF